MTIAIVINTAWNIYNFRRGIANSFLKKGHKVLAIAPRDEYVEKLEKMGCTYIELPMKGVGINPFGDLQLMYRLLRIVQKTSPDVLLTYTVKPNIYGTLVAKLCRRPIICNISGLGTVFIKKTLVSWIAIFLYRISVRYAEHVFFQNDEDQALFTAHVKLQGNTSLLNGSGIDVSAFEPIPSQNQSPVFLMIGRPMIEKGIYEYVGAATMLKQAHPECQFLLIGRWDKGDKRSVSEREMNDWQQEGIIQYLGTTEDISTVIAQVDVVVLASYREGTPRTLLEGGAMGKVLVATDVPGCRHVVTEGYNGFLCEAQSSESLAQAMRRYLALSPEARQQFSENSRSRIVEKFDEESIISSYTQVVSSLVTAQS